MAATSGLGRARALDALAGQATAQVPVALFTWGFDYLWKVAGLEPWQLACGDHETWRRAHIALLERHQPDLIWYSGAGTATAPRLIEEDREQWVIETGARRCGLRKDSLALYDLETQAKGCDSVGEIRSLADFIADGWASCDIISPAMIEQFALPYQRSITEAAHEAGLRIILWNEGDILPILPREAAVPVDAFAFEQPRKGVETTVARVRAAFGPKRCLFGNLDSELLLMRNDPAEIAGAVREQLRQSGANAPFILSTGSPLPSNIDPAAVDAFIHAARGGERNHE